MSELTDHIQAVYQALIARGVQPPDLFPGLELKQDGAGYKCLCPFHSEKTPSFSIAANKPVYYCFGGCTGESKSGDWLSLLRALEGLEFWPALERLENMAGVPRLKRNSQAAAKYEQTRRRAGILTAANAFFMDCLTKDKPTLEYLAGRGYARADIEAAGLGAFPGAKATQGHLIDRGYTEHEIKSALKWIDARADYKVTIPYYDATRSGVIAIMGRLTRPLIAGEKERDKYKPLSDMEGIKAENLFNAPKGQALELILVEGLFDSAILTARGIPAAALGGSDFLDGQLAQAIRGGVQRFILGLDNDPAGIEGTKAAVLKTWKAGRRAYVITYPEGIKDADQLVKAQGLEAFKTILAGKQLAAHWITRRTIDEMPGADICAILDALKPLMIAADPIDRHEMTAAARQALEMPENVLNDFIEMQAEIEAGKELKAEAVRMIRDAQGLINDGDAETAITLLEDRAKKLRAQAVKYESPFYSIPDYLEDEKHEPAGLKTGYDNLDKILSFPNGGITIIAGRPGHGKTTLMLNLMMNQIKRPENQGKTFFFISYEQPKKQLMRRLVMMESGHIVDSAQMDMNYAAIGRALKFGIDHEPIKNALDTLGGYIQAERLALIDHPYFVDELTGMLKKWAGRYQIGGVYVDYIQKVKARGGWKEGYLVLKAISEQFLESAKALKIPIILGAQVNRTAAESMEKLRLESLREAGDLEQDANLVLGLWNKARGAADDTGEPWERDRKTTLYIKVLKNRDGITTKPDKPESLVFDQPILKITDKTKTGTY